MFFHYFVIIIKIFLKFEIVKIYGNYIKKYEEWHTENIKAINLDFACL